MAFANGEPVAGAATPVAFGATATAAFVPNADGDAVTPNVTTVTFTEGLLRSITSLPAEQQQCGSYDKGRFRNCARHRSCNRRGYNCNRCLYRGSPPLHHQPDFRAVAKTGQELGNPGQDARQDL